MGKGRREEVGRGDGIGGGGEEVLMGRGGRGAGRIGTDIETSPQLVLALQSSSINPDVVTCCTFQTEQAA